MSDDFTAAAALAAMQETREAWAARKSGGGFAYEILYGLIVGVIVGGQAIPVPYNLIASLGGAVLISTLSLYCARKSGVWINGAGPRRARWVAIGFGLVFIVMAGGVYAAAGRGVAWIGWPAGIVAGLLGLAAARLWRWVYRSDLADGTDAQPGGIGHRPYGLLVGFGVVILAATSLLAWLTGSLERSWFFYALGAGVGVIGASLVMALVQRMVRRR